MPLDTSKLKACGLFLFDMDGTLYLGDEVFDGAIELMEDLPRLGKRYIYLTNNSSRSFADYVRRLRDLGFPCTEEDVFTSSMACGRYLLEHYPGARVYVAGTRTFYREIAGYGINVVNDEDGRCDAERVDVVLQGFDTELTYLKLERACYFLRHGAALVAANPDWVCPMPAGESIPDCGSICASLTAATGIEPIYIGKPNRNMIDAVSSMTGVPNDRICAVGDRLYTDIAVAQNAGAVSVLVLSGETTQDMADAAERKPEYVLADVAELHRLLK